MEKTKKRGKYLMKEIKTVYVLEVGRDEFKSLQGVFSAKRKAKAVYNKCKNKPTWVGEKVKLTEFVLDEEYAGIHEILQAEIKPRGEK
jgi:hypothetical protein